jgi:uncharacterized protein (TIGR03437 family)
MLARALLCMALLSATAGMAQTSGFLLGVDFAGGTAYGNQMAIDGSGALYFLGSCPVPSYSPLTPPCVTKLAQDGKTLVWQHQVPNLAGYMAVDPNGGVYLSVGDANTRGLYWVDKLSADGASIAWTVPVAWTAPSPWYSTVPPYLTVDSLGRAYVTYAELDQTYVVRVSADGSGRDYMVHFTGSPYGITADGTGSAIVAFTVPGTGFFLTRLSADGSSQIYSIPADFTFGPASFEAPLAADAVGNVAVLGTTLQRYDPHGQKIFSQMLPPVITLELDDAPASAVPALAMDTAGNLYVAGFFQTHSVKNSIVPCGDTTSLMVYGPDGTLLQDTYLPNNGFPLYPLMAAGSDMVYVMMQEGGGLARLSQNSNAQTFPLACVANAAAFYAGSVAPGEVVALFGDGLGPQEGIRTTATMQSPFPTQQAGVVVTFDGTPAPLLWVQDSQVNAVVPWELTPGQNTSVCVTYNSVTTNCLTEPVTQTSPGVFTVDGTYAAALNQDGTVNSAANPAHLFSEITIFATGLGPISPAQPDGSLVGLPLPVNVLPVSFGAPGTPDQHEFGLLRTDWAGPAPYELAGVTQINCYILQYFIGQFVMTSNSDASNLFYIYVDSQ